MKKPEIKNRNLLKDVSSITQFYKKFGYKISESKLKQLKEIEDKRNILTDNKIKFVNLSHKIRREIQQTRELNKTWRQQETDFKQILEKYPAITGNSFFNCSVISKGIEF